MVVDAERRGGPSTADGDSRVTVIGRVLRKYKVDEVILSSPSINGNIERTIRQVCATLDCPVRRLNMSIS